MEHICFGKENIWTVLCCFHHLRNQSPRNRLLYSKNIQRLIIPYLDYDIRVTALLRYINHYYYVVDVLKKKNRLPYYISELLKNGERVKNDAKICENSPIVYFESDYRPCIFDFPETQEILEAKPKISYCEIRKYLDSKREHADFSGYISHVLHFWITLHAYNTSPRVRLEVNNPVRIAMFEKQQQEEAELYAIVKPYIGYIKLDDLPLFRGALERYLGLLYNEKCKTIRQTFHRNHATYWFGLSHVETLVIDENNNLVKDVDLRDLYNIAVDSDNPSAAYLLQEVMKRFNYT